MLNVFYGNEPDSFKDLCESLNNLTGNTKASELAIDWFRNRDSTDMISVDEHLDSIAGLESELEDACEEAENWESNFYNLQTDLIAILKDAITQIEEL